MRTILIAIMLAPSIATVIIMAVLQITGRRFRKRVPKYRGPDDLQRLRSLAKLQMYLSLIAQPTWMYGIVIIAWLLGWLWFKQLGWLDLLLYGVLPIVATFVLAVLGESPARMAVVIPAKNETLAAERDQIVDTWRHKTLPDW